MAKLMATIEEKFSGLDKRLEEMNERLERMAKTRSTAQAEVLEDTSTQRHGASNVGVTQNTPQTGTRMLQGKGLPRNGHHEEEQDQVPVSRLGYRDEKRSEPGGESIRGGIVNDTAPLNPSEPQTSHAYRQQSGHNEIRGPMLR